MRNDVLDPLEANRRAIRTPTCVFEIASEAHRGRLAQTWLTRKTKPSNEKEISHGASLKTIRRECVSAKTRIRPLCGKLKSGSLLMH
jgi:hypothetical protein